MLKSPGRLVWAEIDLARFTKNYQAVRKLLQPRTHIMAVVKGNAYGHGITPIAKQAVSLGATYLGVVCLFEARQLRSAGIKTPILLLNYTDSESIPEAIDLDLSLNLMDEFVLKKTEEIARKKKKRVKIHVKIDTGLHRLGIMPDIAVTFIKKIAASPHVFLEGIFTHFAESDAEDLTFTYKQLEVFKQVLAELSDLGIHPPLIHSANSAATLRVPKSHFTMVRPGKILYGPLPDTSYKMPFVSLPVLSLKTKVVQIRTIRKGESVGYSRTYIAKNDMRIAALPVGYADGFRRAPQNFSEVLVEGKTATLVGRVSMDQSSIDITHIPGVTIGSEVVLIGSQGNKEITTQQVADRIGTINYEVLTSLSERVERIYKK